MHLGACRTEYFQAALAPEGQTHCKVVCAIPEDTEKMPVVGMDGKDFESASDVCLGQPGSLACKVDEGDGMIVY